MTWLHEPGRRTRLEFGPTIDSFIMTIFQLTQCRQAIHGKETYCLAGQKTPVIRHIWLPLFMSSPVRLKGTKIPGH
jgi:hypothetical protein